MSGNRTSVSSSVGDPKFDLQDSILIGIGNDGRSDDGLGWAFVDAVQQSGIFTGRITRRYQLQIEDAELISHVRHVVFVDACRSVLPGGFQYQPCIPAAEFEFTSHKMAPQSVLFLCHKLYQTMPTADLLLIQGGFWNLEIGLSETAQSNLNKSLRFFENTFCCPLS